MMLKLLLSGKHRTMPQRLRDYFEIRSGESYDDGFETRNAADIGP